MNTLIKTGTLLVAVAICTSAGASQLPGYTGLTTSPTLTLQPTVNGPITSPGDAFFPERPTERFPCTIELGEDGEPQVVYSNNSGITFPVGTVVRIVLSNGEIAESIYSLEKFYAGSEIIQGLPAAWVPPLTCEIEIVLAENLPH